MRRRAAFFVAVPLLALGCGGAQPGPSSSGARLEDRGGPAVDRPEAVPMTESDVGAMSEHDVAAILKGAKDGVAACFEQATRKRAYLEGDIEVVIHIARGGKVLDVLPARSTIGDRGAERCLLDLLAKQPWPSPVGGKVGTVKQELGFSARGRAADRIDAAMLGSAGHKARKELAACGSGDLSVTAYLDSEGKVLGAGAATSDPATLSQLDCATEALSSVIFPSPGSYKGKVTITR
ncbi:MAG: AgmX/PglI C-terminal domain-containing protein [Deltaproteobacteria bacterium]|nr:AgmX/PglI C-terminal domain-containing protein [Deltaproteobacteria bacterium]